MLLSLETETIFQVWIPYGGELMWPYLQGLKHCWFFVMPSKLQNLNQGAAKLVANDSVPYEADLHRNFHGDVLLIFALQAQHFEIEVKL